MKKYIISAFVLGAAFAAGAQNLSTEITVDRTVVTDLPAASPLSSVFPTAPAGSSNPFEVKPVQYTQWTDFKPVAGRFNTPLFSGLTAPADWRGYVFAGYFPAYNAEIAAGYRILNGEKTRLGAALRFNGYSYKPGDGIKVKDNTVAAQVDFSHDFNSRIRLFADADYMHSALDRVMSQSLDGFRATLGITRENSISASVGFDYFGAGKEIAVSSGQRWNPAEDKRFTAQAMFRHKFNDSGSRALDFGFKVDILNSTPAVDNYDNTVMLIDIDPTFRFGNDNFKARFGLDINIGFNTIDSKGYLFPQINLAWMPSGIVDVYADLDGGRTYRDLRWQYEVSPFAVGAQGTSVSRNTDVRAGVNIRPLSGLSVGLFGGFSSFWNVPTLMAVSDVTPQNGTVRLPYNFISSRLEGWTYGFEASYQVASFGSVHAGAQFFQDGDPTLGDRAKKVANIGIEAKPVEKLTVNVDYNLRAVRRYCEIFYQHTGDPTIYDDFQIIADTYARLRNMSNLSLGGSYAITPQFSAFIRLENVLGRRYQVLPGLESRAFHGLLGASYLF